MANHFVCNNILELGVWVRDGIGEYRGLKVMRLIDRAMYSLGKDADAAGINKDWVVASKAKFGRNIDGYKERGMYARRKIMEEGWRGFM